MQIEPQGMCRLWAQEKFRQVYRWGRHSLGTAECFRNRWKWRQSEPQPPPPMTFFAVSVPLPLPGGPSAPGPFLVPRSPRFPVRPLSLHQFPRPLCSQPAHAVSERRLCAWLVSGLWASRQTSHHLGETSELLCTVDPGERESGPVVSDSLRPQGLHSPWSYLERVLFLLQGIFLNQGSNPGLPYCRQILCQLSHRVAREHWSAQPIPSPVDLLDPGVELGSPALQADSLTTGLLGSLSIQGMDPFFLPALSTLLKTQCLSSKEVIISSSSRPVYHRDELWLEHFSHIFIILLYTGASYIGFPLLLKKKKTTINVMA